MVVAFLAAVAALWAGAALLHGSVALAVTIAVAVLAVVLILAVWRGAPLSTLVWQRLRARRFEAPHPAPAVDHRLRWTTAHAGVRAAGHELVAVVAVDGPSHSPSVLDHNRVESAATLPVAVVAAALRQFDVTLAGIDIVGAGRRRAPDGHHHYAATYSRMVGDHPAVGQRRVWCVLRLNTFDNVGAIAGRDSAAATLAVCAQRLVVELNAHRCPARLVSGSELNEIDRVLLGGLRHGAQTGWGGLLAAAGTVSGYWVSPRDITTATLDRLWVPDTDATVSTVQLRPASGGGVNIGALVRYTTPGRQKDAPVTGLNPLTGRHDVAVTAGLVDPAAAALLVPSRRLTDDEDLRAPIGSTGIILGVTAARHPLLVPLDDARPDHPATVTVAGELALLIQLAVRSAAADFHVVVLTDRPRQWREVTAAGLRVLSESPDELSDGGRGMMVFYDQAQTGAAVPAAVSVRAVQRGSASVADVHVEQDSNTTAVIRTTDFRYRVHIDVQGERNLIAAASRRVA
jgi:type VII secretion protein EccE